VIWLIDLAYRSIDRVQFTNRAWGAWHTFLHAVLFVSAIAMVGYCVYGPWTCTGLLVNVLLFWGYCRMEIGPWMPWRRNRGEGPANV
jgi:hypothetical protein